MSKPNKPEDAEVLRSNILSKRDAWRRARALRLNKKDELSAKGFKIIEIRREKQYKELRKEQKRISKEIRHLEKKLNRFFH